MLFVFDRYVYSSHARGGLAVLAAPRQLPVPPRGLRGPGPDASTGYVNFNSGYVILHMYDMYHIYICTSICVYIYIYTYTYTHT